MSESEVWIPSGNPPKRPRLIVVRYSRRTWNVLWKCAGGDTVPGKKCFGRVGVSPDWKHAMGQVNSHLEIWHTPTKKNY